MTATQDPGTPAPPPRRRKQRTSLLAKENRRLVAGAIIGAVVALFAVLNLDQVDVNWIFGTVETPLIIVIAVTFTLGAVAGYIARLRR
jgi:uncharacterized integral membrane protein